MFKNPFSFDGRIRRKEYGLSIIFTVVANMFILVLISRAPIFGLGYIAMLWFHWAQGAKRCHDLGNSGWWQIIPFYPLWMLFSDGQPGSNQYGENPKGIQVIGGQPVQVGQNKAVSGTGYQGGYSGGHNNPNTSYTSTEKSDRTDGYNDGDLYK